MPNGFGNVAGSFVQGFRAGESDVLSREERQLQMKAQLQNMQIQGAQNARAQETHDIQKQQIQRQDAYIKQLEGDYIRSTLQDSVRRFWDEDQPNVNAVKQALQSPVMQNFLGTKNLNMLNTRDDTDRGYAKQWLTANGIKPDSITPEMVDGIINSNVLLKTDSGEPLDMYSLTVGTGTFKYMNQNQRRNFEAVMSGATGMMTQPGDIKGDIAQNIAGLMAQGLNYDQALAAVQSIKGKLPSSDIQVLSQAFNYIQANNMEPTTENVREVVSSFKGKSARAGEPATPVDKAKSYQELRADLGLKAPTQDEVMDVSKASPEDVERLTVLATESFGDFSNTAKTEISNLLAHENDFKVISGTYDPSQTGLVDATWQSINAYLGLGSDKTIKDSKAVMSAYTSAIASLRHTLYGATLTDKELADANRQFGTLWQSDEASAQNFVNVLDGYISKLRAIRQDNKNIFDLKHGQSLIQLQELKQTIQDAKQGQTPLKKEPVNESDLDKARNEIMKRLRG